MKWVEESGWGLGGRAKGGGRKSLGAKLHGFQEKIKYRVEKVLKKGGY